METKPATLALPIIAVFFSILAWLGWVGPFNPGADAGNALFTMPALFSGAAVVAAFTSLRKDLPSLAGLLTVIALGELGWMACEFVRAMNNFGR